MSQEVLQAQQWLNSTYGHNPGYKTIKNVNGLPGSALSAALVSAMQIELGMSTVTGVFGDLTMAACNANPLEVGISTGNRVKIMQCGLYGKGYNPLAMDGIFTLSTIPAIQQIQVDAGLSGSQISTDIVKGLQLKAILGVDEYMLVPGGDYKIRTIQRDLNSRYLAYTGLRACDGHYSRSTNEAIILAFQAEEGMPTSMANGNFGPSTTLYCPDIGTNQTQWGMNGAYSSTTMGNFILLAQYILYCLGRSPYQAWSSSGSNYNPGAFNSIFDADTIAALNQFQLDAALPRRNMIGLNEWMGMLVSTGNPNRNALAADCATCLTTTAHAMAIYNDDYRVVGRYLTGTIKNQSGTSVSKALTRSEAENILACGLRLFLIYQDPTEYYQQNQNEEDIYNYFTYARGFSDAQKAAMAAQALGAPYTEYIYFAVDYDFMQDEVYAKVVPYFEGIRDFAITGSFPYRIGIYGSRNTCGIISRKNLATSSFVGDLSTGYSGNLGFPLPFNWAFDQIKEYNLWSSSGTFAIDKNVTSGRYIGFDYLVPLTPTTQNLSTVTSFEFEGSYVDEIGVKTVTGIVWKDDWFSDMPSKYNHKLATASIALSTVGYSKSKQLIEDSYVKLGFSPGDIKIVAESDDQDYKTIRYSFAIKKIDVGGIPEDLIIIAIGGTANVDEWVSDMDVADRQPSSLVHHGFDVATFEVYDEFMSWLSTMGITAGTGNEKVLITGHSRGAAVGNLLASRLVSSNIFNQNNVFAYLFATPNVATTSSYSSNIHNIVSPEDFVTKSPLAIWGYGKYGKTSYLPSRSNYNLATYSWLKCQMAPYFRLLTEKEFKNFPDGSDTVDGFIADVAYYAPTVLAYYTTAWGQGGATTYDFFVGIANYLGTQDNFQLVLVANAMAFGFNRFLSFLNTSNMDYIWHAHCQEAYLAWMQSQEDGSNLF